LIKTKICIDCRKQKPVSRFTTRSDSRDGYRNQCRKCYYGKKRIKKYEAIQYKGGKCKLCGYGGLGDFYGALEFHHRDPRQKDILWKTIRTYPLEYIKEELDKCDLLCANCHREEHYRLNMKKWEEE
jgi:hypothetical protein